MFVPLLLVGRGCGGVGRGDGCGADARSRSAGAPSTGGAGTGAGTAAYPSYPARARGAARAERVEGAGPARRGRRGGGVGRGIGAGGGDEGGSMGGKSTDCSGAGAGVAGRLPSPLPRPKRRAPRPTGSTSSAPRASRREAASSAARASASAALRAASASAAFAAPAAPAALEFAALEPPNGAGAGEQDDRAQDWDDGRGIGRILVVIMSRCGVAVVLCQRRRDGLRGHDREPRGERGTARRPDAAESGRFDRVHAASTAGRATTRARRAGGNAARQRRYVLCRREGAGGRAETEQHNEHWCGSRRYGSRSHVTAHCYPIKSGRKDTATCGRSSPNPGVHLCRDCTRALYQIVHSGSRQAGPARRTLLRSKRELRARRARRLFVALESGWLPRRLTPSTICFPRPSCEPGSRTGRGR